MTLVANHTPADADRLLIDPERISWACDLARNPGFAKADARSRGADGDRLVDVYRLHPSKHWEQRLQAHIQAPLEDFRRGVPAILVKTINGGRPHWGPQTDSYWDDGVERVQLESAKKRDVVVPCVYTRMLHNLVDDVLQATSDHLLPDAARAYRHGMEDAVPRTIIEISRAVRGGARYWAKLDIRSFFPTMQWSHLERSLLDLGYSEDFTARVMALVTAPLVDEHGNSVPNDRGAQAGLRLSGTLANIYLRDLDLLVTQRFGGRVSYWRYCDDIILVGGKRPELVGAVRKIRNWVAARGQELKHVGRKMAADALVHDIKKKRIDPLGTEVNARGTITIPEGKRAAFVRRVRHRLDYMPPEGAIIGTSNYATWIANRGRYAFDGEDAQRQLDQFENHWGLLNGLAAREFLDGLHQEHEVDPSLHGLGLTHTWVAVLPARSGRLARESIWSGKASGARLLSTIAGAPAPPLGLLRGLEVRHRPMDDHSDHPFCADDSSSAIADDGSLSWMDNRQPKWREPPKALDDDSLSLGESSSEIMEAEEDDPLALLPSPDAGFHSLDSSPPNPERERDLAQEMDSTPEMEEGPVGFVTAAGEAEALPPRAVRRDVLVEVVRRQRGRNGPLTTLRVRRGGNERLLTQPMRSPSAVVEAIIDELRLASAVGVDLLIVWMPESWLAKALVQRTARFHAVTLFDRVLRLHETVRRGPTDVVIVGGFHALPEHTTFEQATEPISDSQGMVRRAGLNRNSSETLYTSTAASRSPTSA